MNGKFFLDIFGCKNIFKLKKEGKIKIYMVKIINLYLFELFFVKFCILWLKNINYWLLKVVGFKICSSCVYLGSYYKLVKKIVGLKLYLKNFKIFKRFKSFNWV